jgi:uncharacterized membrane protein
VNVEYLLDVASGAGVVIVCERRPGHYVSEGQSLARVDAGSLDGDLARQIQKGFLLGDVRTPEQDFEFTFFQLAEVAMRALSPSLNDPNTAMNCIDRIGTGLRLAAARHEPRHRFAGRDGQVRVVTWRTRFADVLGAALDQLRHRVGHNLDVACRLLEMLAGVAEATRTQAQRDAIDQQALLVAEPLLASGLSEYDRSALRSRLEAVQDLTRPPDPG